MKSLFCLLFLLCAGSLCAQDFDPGTRLWRPALLPREGRIVQVPEWGWLDKEHPYYGELTGMATLAFSSFMNSAVLSCPRKGAEPGWQPPFQLMTSHLNDDSSAHWAEFIHGTKLGGIRRKDMPQILARHFDLIDLFGCAADAALCELLSALDSKGTLVLPFTGMDFKKVTRLPPRIERLVIYNAAIPRDFGEYFETLDRLEELVFWGCTTEEPSSPGESSVDFGVLAERLKVLSVIQCSPALDDSIGWTSMAELTKVHTTDMTLFKQQAWEFRTKYKKQPVSKLPPSFPKLRQIVCFLKRSPAYGGDDKREEEAAADVLRGGLGRESVEIQMVR